MEQDPLASGVTEIFPVQRPLDTSRIIASHIPDGLHVHQHSCEILKSGTFQLTLPCTLRLYTKEFQLNLPQSCALPTALFCGLILIFRDYFYDKT